MSLPAHLHEVEAIAAKAEKDVKVESAIKNFEEVWLSKLFSLTEYQQTFTSRSEVRVFVHLCLCLCVCLQLTTCVVCMCIMLYVYSIW